MQALFWLDDLKGTDSLEELCVKENNIRTDLREIVWEVVDWIHVTGGKD
jgi:hypothetical protein